MNALQLFGVAGLEPGDQTPLAPETELVAYRDLGAIVRAAPWARPAEDGRDVDGYRAVIEAVFARRTLIPAPVGTLFRTRLGVQRWLELHYVSLSDGLGFVEGRAVARLHARVDPSVEGGVAATEPQLTTVFRELRRQSVAAIPLPREAGGAAAEVCIGSFLVERERWRAFEAAAAELAARIPALAVRLTGPWPPYDFVRLQFGG